MPAEEEGPTSGVGVGARRGAMAPRPPLLAHADAGRQAPLLTPACAVGRQAEPGRAQRGFVVAHGAHNELQRSPCKMSERRTVRSAVRSCRMTPCACKVSSRAARTLRHTARTHLKIGILPLGHPFMHSLPSVAAAGRNRGTMAWWAPCHLTQPRPATGIWRPPPQAITRSLAWPAAAHPTAHEYSGLGVS